MISLPTERSVKQICAAHSTEPYISASGRRIHFGLSKRSKIDSLTITWPSGQVDKLVSPPVDRIIAIKVGVGLIPHAFPKVPRR